MGLFASIAGAVAGPLVSGLFGSKDRKVKTENRTDFEQLRRDAEKAGFNPLTALRQTSVQSGTSTTTHPALSSSEFIGKALGAGITAYANHDPHKATRDALEIDIMRGELDRIQRDRTAPRGGFAGGVPVSITYSDVATGPVQSRPAASGPPGGGFWEEADTRPTEDVPLTGRNRTGAEGGRSWIGLNPDAWEIGVSELAGGALVHGTGWLAHKGHQWWNHDPGRGSTMPESGPLPGWADHAGPQ